MWSKVTFTHPSVRRFRTAISLTGEKLVQELTGRQQRTMSAMGASPGEYTAIVREFEGSNFVDEMQFSASEQIHPGIDVLSVEGSGSRKLAPGVVYPASYEYTPGRC